MYLAEKSKWTFKEILAEYDIRELWYIISMRHKLPPLRAERLYNAYHDARKEMLGLSTETCKSGILQCELVIDEEDGGAPNTYFDSSIVYVGDTEKYAFEFTDWMELIGCEVNYDCLQKYGALIVTAELLWEMTFCGFDRETVHFEAKQLAESINEIESKHDERIGKPAKELFVELEAEIKQRKNSQEEQNAKEWFINAPVSVKIRIFEKLKADVLNKPGDEISDEVFAQIVHARSKESAYKYKGCETAESLICTMMNSLDYDDMAYLAELLQNLQEDHPL